MLRLYNVGIDLFALTVHIRYTNRICWLTVALLTPFRPIQIMIMQPMRNVVKLFWYSNIFYYYSTNTFFKFNFHLKCNLINIILW